MWQWLVDAVFPRRCAGCGVAGAAVCCARCAERVASMGLPAAAVRGGVLLCAAFPYQWPVRDLVLAGKRGGGEASLRLLGLLVAERVGGRAPAPDAVVAVPLGRRRRRVRGFNQAEVLAGHVGAALGVPAVRALRRSRETPTQVGRGPAARAANVAAAFDAVLPLRGTVWVIDDVLTSGATLLEAAATALGAGASAVCGVAVAAASSAGTGADSHL